MESSVAETAIFFGLWTWSFWLLVGLEFISGFVWMTKKENALGIIVVFAGVCLLQILGKIPIFQIVKSGGWHSVMYVGLYVLAAILYASLELIAESSRFKDDLMRALSDFSKAIKSIELNEESHGSEKLSYQNRSRELYFMTEATFYRTMKLICNQEGLREIWVELIESGVVPDDLSEAWKECKRDYFNERTVTIEARKYKDEVITWMIWWPFCLVWRMIDKLILNLWETVFEFCKGYFQRLINFVFRNVDSSLLKK